MSLEVQDVRLTNVGDGPESFSLAELAADADVDAVVLLLQRDAHCPLCRRQVQAVAARYDEFRAAATVVVSVVPDDAATVRRWQDAYDLPFPLLADPEATLGESYEQLVRFGALGRLHDMVGRMPEAVVFDTRDGDLRTAFVHRGRFPADRPSVDDLLEQTRFE